MFTLLKQLFIGKPKNPHDDQIFHRLSLIAFFAWIGLGADGLSSSCYGPEAAFLALGEHKYLGVFVALLSALTIFLISASYSQIIELFPNGGGGYFVASKLLNPTVGMVSGCALLIDYVLTIAISIASGADALFSSLPPDLQQYKIAVEVAGVILLMVMNMRGAKETVLPLVPIFLTFLFTHLFAIIYTLVTHVHHVPDIIKASTGEMNSLHAQIGSWAVLFVILKAFSLGAGTFTGIEAVSNGLPMLREPKAATGKRTMWYMAWSLAITVIGLMLGYLLFDLHKDPAKTLNATLFEQMTLTWQAPWAHVFIIVTLISEATLLFVAAQAGFLDGPRVLANMALDRWAPTQFASFSDRLVSQNGIILMGVASLFILALTRGSVEMLVIFYSINVFITFCLSQTGMVVHWWKVRKENKTWLKKIMTNGLGLSLTGFILVSMVILKFHEGGWLTLAMTGALAVGAWNIRRHYQETFKKLKSLSSLVNAFHPGLSQGGGNTAVPDKDSKTAIVLVNGFNGLGLHTLLNIVRYFGKNFKNFVFVQVGVIDSSNFKGAAELTQLKSTVEADLKRYESLMGSHGYYAKGYYALGTDVILEIDHLVTDIVSKHKDCVVFAGQLVFSQESLLSKLLHNYTVFAAQKRLYHQGIPFMILPIRID